MTQTAPTAAAKQLRIDTLCTLVMKLQAERSAATDEAARATLDEALALATAHLDAATS